MRQLQKQPKTIISSLRYVFVGMLGFGLLFCFFFLSYLSLYGATWVVTEIDPVGAFGDSISGRSASIVVEDEDTIHVAYCGEFSDDPEYNLVDGGVVSSTERIYQIPSSNNLCNSSQNERRVAVALDGSTPVVAFSDSAAGKRVFIAIRNGAGSGDATDTDWNQETISTTTVNSVHQLDLDISATGTYGIAAFDTNRLYYFSCTTTCENVANWTTETVDNTQSVIGRSPRIVYKSDGTPVIAYYDSNNSNLRYAIRDGGGAAACTDANWSCYDLDAVGASADNNGSIGIDVDSSDRIGIVYSDDSDSDLNFAYEDGGGTGCSGDVDANFTCETIVAVSGSPSPSIVFDGTMPFVSYYEPVADDVRFGYKEDGSWNLETVKDTGDVGKFSDIGRSGTLVAIGYHDDTDDEFELATTSLAFNAAPTVTTSTAVQASATSVTTSVSVADSDGNTTSLDVQHSTNGTTWVSSTLGAVTPSIGAISTTTGQVIGIDTNTTTITLTIDWQMATDLGTADDSTVYMRFRASDGTATSDWASTSAFAVDTTAPSAPGNLSISSTSTTGVVLSLGATSTDTNFDEYKIFYTNALSGVTTTDTEHDASVLSVQNYATPTTTQITGLATGTAYTANIWAYDTWGRHTSAASEQTFYTLAATPGTPTVTASSTSSTAATVVVNQATNPASNVTYSICVTANGSSCQSNGYVQSDGTLGASADWNSYTTWGSADGVSVTGLSLNTSYQFLVKARNGDNVETSFSSANTAVYSGVNVPTEVAVSATTQTSVTVSWNENGNPTSTQYAAIFTNGTTSGLVTDTSHDFSSLSCGTQYIVSVTAYNTDSSQSETSSSLSFTTSACDEETSGDSGGGGGDNPPPPPEPPPEPPTEEDEPLCQLTEAECDMLQPTGTLQIHKEGQQVLYTNSTHVSVVIDGDYADLVGLKESSRVIKNTDFSGIPFQPVESVIPWVLDAGDGKKCINGIFKNSAAGWTSDVIFACVILDTVAPSPPNVVDIAQVSVRTNGGRITATGVAEPNALVVATVTDARSASARWFDRIVDFFFPTAIAASGGTYHTTANSTGRWTITSSLLPPGHYDISVVSQDAAGNTSAPDEHTVEVSSGGEGESPSDDGDAPLADDGGDDAADTDSGDTSDTGSDTGPAPAGLSDGSGSSNPGSGSSSSGGSHSSSPQEDVVVDDVGEVESSEEIEEPQPVVGVLGETVAKAAAAIRAFIDNPEIEEVNETVVAPTVVVAAVANVALGLSLPQVMAFLHYVFGQPFLLLRMRKRKSWGVVYNGFTKQPIDLATVRLIDAKTNKIIQSRVTDRQGRYFFMAPAGAYKLEVQKPGYEGLSDHLKKVSEDGKYIGLYHGNKITLSKDYSVIKYNIPIDPEGAMVSTARVLKDHAKRAFQTAFALFGVVLTSISFIISPTPIIATFLVLHLLFFALFHRLTHAPVSAVFGTVNDIGSRISLPRVVVRVFDSQYDKLVETRVTDGKGRYAVLVGPSKYYVTYDKPGYRLTKSPVLDYSSEKTAGVGGIVARNEALVKKRKTRAS